MKRENLWSTRTYHQFWTNAWRGPLSSSRCVRMQVIRILTEAQQKTRSLRKASTSSTLRRNTQSISILQMVLSAKLFWSGSSSHLCVNVGHDSVAPKSVADEINNILQTSPERTRCLFVSITSHLLSFSNGFSRKQPSSEFPKNTTSATGFAFSDLGVSVAGEGIRVVL